jgi:hypothetical protein
MSGPWVQYSDEDLLKVRLCDLRLDWEQSPFLKERVARLYQELEQKGFKSFRPRIYLGDEWFSPEGIGAIAIPFYLAHPRLAALERKMLFEAEGEDPAYCLKLLRHEAGHCLDHSYQISKRNREFRNLFGVTQDYDPDHYMPRPYSRNYVIHLDRWYAQAHPDEDFAETFAVWLDPESQWKTRYSKWKKALEKLQFIEKLIPKFGEKVPLKSSLSKESPYSSQKMKSTLAQYYRKKKKNRQEELPDFYDEDLRQIFGGIAVQSLKSKENSAHRYLQKRQDYFINLVHRWTGGPKYLVYEVLKKLKTRAEAHNLTLTPGHSKDSDAVEKEMATYLAVLVTHYLFTGKFKRTV